MKRTTMSKIAIDTNVLLYAIDDFYPEKQSISIGIIAEKPYFCTQSVSEFINVCLRKWKLPKEHVAELLETYLEQARYIQVSEQMLLRSVGLMKRYDFQLFDAIIVSAALGSGCEVLYSEDMKDGQIIDNQLKITNPFKQHTS